MLYLLIFIILIPVVVDLVFTHIKQIRGTSQETKNGLRGMTGLYRALMTFGLILIVGLIVVYLTNLITSNIDKTGPNVDALLNILQNLAAILGTALATVIAFYFGIRGSERAAERGQPPADTAR
jgi:predicted PurR-regulated permease PerM